MEQETSPDFRALCAELADALETWCETWHPLAYTDPRISLRLIANRARAALAAEAEGPSDEELIRLAITSGIEEWWAEEDGNGWTEYSGKAVSVLAFARAVLARYGSAPRPIPVAERLPGAGDCDSSGECWFVLPT